MPYPELILRDAPPPGEGLPTRADVAVFAGLVARRPGPLPDSVRAALTAAGWAGSGPFARSPAEVEALLDLPVAVTSWAAFDALYAWNRRALADGSPRTLPCPLGLAVRSFFTEGGLKAWIVRTGDPLPLLSDAPPDDVRTAKRRLLSWANGAPPPGAGNRVALLPGLANIGTPVSTSDPATWHGAAHVLGIDDAAMLAVPDLAELSAPAPEPVPDLPEPPPIPEAWKPCAEDAPGFEPDARTARPDVSASRLDRRGYVLWGSAVAHLLAMLAAPRGSAHRRDVMLIASLPLPRHDPDLAGYEAEPLRLLDEIGLPAPMARLFNEGWAGSARLQLAYPWVATTASASQPEGIEAPEGVLAGAIARTALAEGAFRSAAGSLLASLRTTVPELRGAAIRAALPDGRADWMGDRLCLISAKPRGLTLISDATTAPSRDWRAGGVSRLMGVILRAARWLGQDRLFEPAGPALWAELTLDLESFLDQLWQLGALAGANADQAYRVRCDATTMSQNDIDAGRTIVSITFTAAQPVQRITVMLALGADGVTPLAEAA